MDNSTKLYERIRMEYDLYKKDLLTKSKEEIFLNNYQISIYNEILTLLEEIDIKDILGKEVIDRMLKMDESISLIEYIYNEWLFCERLSSIRDDICSCIRNSFHLTKVCT